MSIVGVSQQMTTGKTYLREEEIDKGNAEEQHNAGQEIDFPTAMGDGTGRHLHNDLFRTTG